MSFADDPYWQRYARYCAIAMTARQLWIRDELIAEAPVALVEAARDFNPDGPANFKTCLSWKMLSAKTRVLNGATPSGFKHHGKRGQAPLTVSFNDGEPLWLESRLPPACQEVDDRDLLDWVLKHLKPDELELIKAHYFDGEGFEAIGRRLGRSKVTTFRTIAKIRERIRKRANLT